MIVPVYNVEAYLADCLDSLIAQTYSNLDIVLVDDGSTDGSAAICERYARRDARCRLVRQTNAGLGAARNRGVEEARGKFIAFVDSDDLVPVDAYSRLMSVLMDSGSDFVVGSIARQVADGSYREPQWARRLHSHRRVSVTVEEVPEVLANIFACTKVFRRSFWDRVDLTFPVGVHYEDQMPMTRAYLDATSFDMVAGVVYNWRTRSDGTSITQRKSELLDLQHRLDTKREVASLLRTYPSARVRESWFEKVLRYDMPVYYRAALEAEEGYWAHLVDGMRELTWQLDDSTWRAVPVEHRLSAFLVAAGRRKDYEELLAFLDANTHGFPTRDVEGCRVADLPLAEEAGSSIPAVIYEITDADVRLVSRLTGMWWRGEGVLSLRGGAFLTYFGRGDGNHQIEVLCRERISGSTVALPVVRFEDPRVNVWAGRAWQDHSDAGFEVDLDVRKLLSELHTGDQVWDLRIRVRGENFEEESFLGARMGRSSASDVPPSVIGGRLVAPVWRPKLGLTIEVNEDFALLSGAEVTPHDVVLDVRTGSVDLRELTLCVEGQPVAVLPAERTAPQTFRCRVGTDQLVDGWRDVTALLGQRRGANTGVVPLRGLSNDTCLQLAPKDANPVIVSQSLNGSVAIGRMPVLLADELAFEDDRIHLRGAAHGVMGFRCALVGPRASSAWVEGRLMGDRFEVTLTARSSEWGARPLLLQDSYRVVFVVQGGAQHEILLSRTVREELPRRHAVGWTRWDVEVTSRAALLLGRRPAWRDDEEGQFAQRRLRTDVYASARTEERLPVVVFESFNGKTVGDSPGAICDYLLQDSRGLSLVWSVADSAVTVPEGTRAVLRHTREWYELVGRAAFLVSNNNFPAFFRKASDQVHVQTWHGTPLKRIGHDIENLQFAGNNYMRVMDAEASRWDYLVSPSPYCSKIFPQAFAYEGPLLELGYPRNDILVRPESQEIRAQVRASFGFRDDQTVVLYAPTWRETARVGRSYDKVLHLDAAKVVSALDDAVVLIRGHANTASRPATRLDGTGGVLDVTLYPDVAHLFLAADVLVTDYSSVMFDFALTGKPILLLVPDLETYRDRTRGFYFDLESEAPGPLLRTTDEVVSALQQPSEARFTEAQSSFVSRFAPMDDGHATERVVDAIFTAQALSSAGVEVS